MKKPKKILLVLGIILIVTVLLFGFAYPFGGNSLANRLYYSFFHKDRLHLSGNYHYKVTQYHQTDLFGSFAIIEFESQDDLSNLELIYAKDPNIQHFKDLYDSTSIGVFEEYIGYLPVEINCGCYTLYVINAFQFDGGYFYHVYVIGNKLYIFYTSR
jgi:hypothetical protein